MRRVPHSHGDGNGNGDAAAAEQLYQEMSRIGATLGGSGGGSFARLLAAEAAKARGGDGEPATVAAASPFSVANACWLLAALALLGYTDLLPLVMFDTSSVRRGWLIAGACLIGVTLCLALYCALYLTTYLRVPSSQWERRHPTVIPIAAGSFVLGSLCLTYALWPVYHLLTLPILFTLVVACAILVAMIPNSLLPDVPEPEEGDGDGEGEEADGETHEEKNDKTD